METRWRRWVCAVVVAPSLYDACLYCPPPAPAASAVAKRRALHAHAPSFLQVDVERVFGVQPSESGGEGAFVSVDDLTALDVEGDVVEGDAAEGDADAPENSTRGVLVSAENRSAVNRTVSKELVAVTNKSMLGPPNMLVNMPLSADHLLEKAEHVFTKVAQNVGMKSQAANTTQEAKKPFIKVTKHTTDDGATIKTSIKVDIVKPADIVSVYLIVFIPLSVAWSAYYSLGMQPGHLAMLLPLSLLATMTGMDFANQSLAAVIGGPNLLTSLQAWALTLITGFYTISFRRPEVYNVDGRAIWVWMAAAAAFTVTQLVNHLAYWNCSLYERTVFTNLCPVATVMIERMVMPAMLKPSIGFWNKFALTVTMVGSAILGLDGFNLSTASSISTASLLVVSLVLTRLTQRYLLAMYPTLPVMLLACIDGLLLALTSTTLAASEVGGSWDKISLTTWLQEPSVHILVVLSMLTFTGYHIVILLILRFTSATNSLVFMNIANILNVALGVEFFGDSLMKAFLTPIALLGLGVSLFGGLYYAGHTESVSVFEGNERAQGGTGCCPESAADGNLLVRARTSPDLGKCG